MTRRDTDVTLTANPNSSFISNTRELHAMTANPNSNAIFNARELRAFTANRNSSAVTNAHLLHTWFLALHPPASSVVSSFTPPPNSYSLTRPHASHLTRRVLLPLSGAASTGSSWAEGVRAWVAVRSRWRCAIVIGNRGVHWVRGGCGAAIAIRRPATVDGTFLLSRWARVKNPTFLAFLERKCVKRTLISTEFYLRTVPQVHFRLNETPIFEPPQKSFEKVASTKHPVT